MVWANVSPFLPRVVVVVRVCFRISVRQPALWTYSVRELGKGCPCSLPCCQLWKELAGCNLPSSSCCSDAHVPFHAPELSASHSIRARALFSFLFLFFKLSHWQDYRLPVLPLRLQLILTAKGRVSPSAPPQRALPLAPTWKCSRHALCGAAQGAASGAGLVLGYWEGGGSSSWSKLGASHMWKATPALEISCALPCVQWSPLLHLFPYFFPSNALHGELFESQKLSRKQSLCAPDLNTGAL